MGKLTTTFSGLPLSGDTWATAALRCERSTSGIRRFSIRGAFGAASPATGRPVTNAAARVPRLAPQAPLRGARLPTRRPAVAGGLRLALAHRFPELATRIGSPMIKRHHLYATRGAKWAAYAHSGARVEGRRNMAGGKS
jgi:hypothetical protein